MEVTKESTAQLRARLQGTAPEGDNETYVGQTVRFFSIYFTRIFAKTSLTPNQLTVLSVLVFFAGLCVFMFRSYTLNFLGLFLVYFSIIIDACDGEIARLKGNKSGIGGIYVEPLSHDIQYGLMFIPLTLAVYLGTGDATIIYVGYAATVLKLLYRFLLIRFEPVLAIKTGNTGVAPKGDRYVSLPHKIYKFFNRNIFSSVGLIIPLLIFCILDRVDLFIWLFALGFLAIFLANFLYQIRFVIKHQ